MPSIEEAEVLEFLADLIEKSLVIHDGGGRYRLLETVRQYGRGRLNDAGESPSIRARHADCFLALAEEAEPQLTGADQQEWLERLETEHDNLRVALEWSLERRALSVVDGDPTLNSQLATINSPNNSGLRLAGALWPFWEVRGHFSEGRRQLERALAGDGVSGEARAKALHGAGGLAWRQGAYAEARALHEQSLLLSRELGDQRGIAASLTGLGNAAWRLGDYASARTRHEEALAIRRELGDRWGVAGSLNNLGIVASDQGDYASARLLYSEALEFYREVRHRWGCAAALGNLATLDYDEGDYASARPLIDEALAIYRQLGDRWGMAVSLNNLGLVAYELGEYISAGSLFAESLAFHREAGDQQGIATALDALASVASAQGRAERAASLWGAGEAIREGIGSPLTPTDLEKYERQVGSAQAALGEAAFDSAFSEGHAMTWEQAVEYALSEEPSSASGLRYNHK